MLPKGVKHFLIAGRSVGGDCDCDLHAGVAAVMSIKLKVDGADVHIGDAQTILPNQGTRVH